MLLVGFLYGVEPLPFAARTASSLKMTSGVKVTYFLGRDSGGTIPATR